MSYSRDTRKGNLVNWIKHKKPVYINDKAYGFTKKNNKWKLVELY